MVLRFSTVQTRRRSWLITFVYPAEISRSFCVTSILRELLQSSLEHQIQGLPLLRLQSHCIRILFRQLKIQRTGNDFQEIRQIPQSRANLISTETSITKNWGVFSMTQKMYKNLGFGQYLKCFFLLISLEAITHASVQRSLTKKWRNKTLAL